MNELLAKWQKRLGLSDWDIKVGFRDARDMGQLPANAHIQECIQAADIRIMAKDDRQASDPADADFELDLVHE